MTKLGDARALKRLIAKVWRTTSQPLHYKLAEAGGPDSNEVWSAPADTECPEKADMVPGACVLLASGETLESKKVLSQTPLDT